VTAAQGRVMRTVAPAANRRPPRRSTAASTASAGPAPIGPKGSFRLELDDEFNGRSLNRGVWNTQYPWNTPNNNGDSSIEGFFANHVAVKDGNLLLTASKGRFTGRNISGGPEKWPWASGMVNTYGKFVFRYGVIEARMKVPAGSGSWPAIWALPENGSWPPEVDDAEVYGDQPDLVDMTYHWGTPSDPRQQHFETRFPHPLSAGFHVFTVDVEPRAITWYIDGKRQWSFTNVADLAQLKPLYLIIDLDVGGDGGTPGNGPFTAAIDYVRVWSS
jgi:beta-glucanase (GH16 family)